MRKKSRPSHGVFSVHVTAAAAFGAVNDVMADAKREGEARPVKRLAWTERSLRFGSGSERKTGSAEAVGDAKAGDALCLLKTCWQEGL